MIGGPAGRSDVALPRAGSGSGWRRWRQRASPCAGGSTLRLGTEEQWCARHLLARLHSYSQNRLRREIEPVSAQDFMRFLLRWQHVAPGTRRQGRAGLLSVIEQLQGFELAAGAWEEAILSARVEGYQQRWLEDLCLSGEVELGPSVAPSPRGRRATAAGSFDAIASHPGDVRAASRPALAHRRYQGRRRARRAGARFGSRRPGRLADIWRHVLLRPARRHTAPAYRGAGGAVGPRGSGHRHRRRLWRRAVAVLST